MAKIKYTFSDGHEEEIEVTEDFKAAYEFELAREKARYYKQYRQKERAGIPTGHDWSLDKMTDDGIDYAAKDDPLRLVEQREERRQELNRRLSILTERQKEVYILYLKGWKQVSIAKKLRITPAAVCYRLQNAKKRIQLLRHQKNKL